MQVVRWGMIGCGAVTEVKSGPAFAKAKRSRLLAVTSARPAHARAWAARHGVDRVYDTVADLLAAPDIDAVYIATPPVHHKPLVLAAAAAGKHAYVEKPMALTFADCTEMIAACAAARRELFVAYYRRAMPRFLAVREWLQQGAIGPVRTVGIIQRQPPAAEERSAATLPWRVRPEIAGGGKFLDMGVHALDLLDWWFGPIGTVAGVATNHAGLYAAEDTVSACWQHESGVIGFGSWCYAAADACDRLEISGAEGGISLEVFSDAPLILRARGHEERRTIVNPEHVQQPFIQSIVDQLTGCGRCPGDAASAARTTRVADEILARWRVEAAAQLSSSLSQ
jgi:predicted dehydrogenase